MFVLEKMKSILLWISFNVIRLIFEEVCSCLLSDKGSAMTFERSSEIVFLSSILLINHDWCKIHRADLYPILTNKTC